MLLLLTQILVMSNRKVKLHRILLFFTSIFYNLHLFCKKSCIPSTAFFILSYKVSFHYLGRLVSFLSPEDLHPSNSVLLDFSLPFLLYNCIFCLPIFLPLDFNLLSLKLNLSLAVLWIRIRTYFLGAGSGSELISSEPVPDPSHCSFCL